VKYLLDTNTCIYIINKKPPSAVNRIRSKQAEEIAISTITIAELEYGVYRSQRADQNRIALLEFLVPFIILDFDQSAAAIYGSIRASLKSRGTPIGPMDLLLAAQAMSRQLVLVTNNEKEFRRVRGLQIENWIIKQ
jgi:tRNA(fMet)-specific endonuclease VapC